MNTYRLVCIKEPFPIDSKDRKIIKERHSWYVFRVDTLNQEQSTVDVQSVQKILTSKRAEKILGAIHLGGFFSGKKGAKIKHTHLKKYVDEAPSFVFERELAEAPVFSQKETKEKNLKKLLKDWLSEVVSFEVQSLSK